MRYANRPSVRVACAGLLLLLGACTTERKHELLTIFFDGVPPLDGDKAAAAPDEKTNAPPERPKPPEPIDFIHEPYREHECRVCHTSDRSEKMKDTMTAVCFGCHDDFLAGTRFQHEPAEEGDCTACHNAHRSPFPKLLVKAGDALCYDCHDQADMVAVAAHANHGQETCVSCHNPHASNRKGLLK